MSCLTFLTFVSLLSVSTFNLINGQNRECQNTQANGYYGFCTSSNCCNGMTVTNLCPQGVCCYGRNSCSNQNPSTDTNRCPTTYSRVIWKALKSRNPLKDLNAVNHIFIHHTNDGNSCADNESCSLRVRSLQSYHQLTKKWDDISWNFLIGGDGKVYEGVGWKKQGFHTLNMNDKSLGIAFIGNFNDQNERTESILDNMLNSLDNLITCGINIGQIKSEAKLHGHRDLNGSTTKCPGDYLYSELQEQFNSYQGGPIS